MISEEEAVQIIAEPLVPLQSSTLRDYVDHSETLEKLVHLGMCDFFFVWSAYGRSFGDPVICALLLLVTL